MRTSRPRAPSRRRLAGARNAEASSIEAAEHHALPLELIRAHGHVERLQDEVTDSPRRSLAAAEPLRLGGRSEGCEHVGRRRHLGGADGEAVDDLRRTDVSAGIDGEALGARVADSSASRRASSTPCRAA